MTTNRWMWSRCAATLAIFAGAAFAADYDPTGQAGQYQSLRPAELVKGAGGSFDPSTVHVSFIEDGALGLFNASVAEVINGRPFGAVTTFGLSSSPRQVAMFAPTDAGSALSSGESVNQILVELGTNTFSNSIGSLLPDGTLSLYERFGTTAGQGQNNIGYWNAAHALASGAGVRQAPNKVIVNTQPNVGNAGETGINPTTPTILGGVFIGTPSSTRDPNTMGGNDADLITGNTHFNNNPTLTAVQFASAINGVAVYGGRDNPSTSGTPGSTNGTFNPAGHVAAWLQSSVPLPTNPGGESRGDARQTQPVLATVNTPAGGSLVYVAHGIGFSGGSPFNGGSARVLYIAVDAITDGIGAPRTDYVGSNPVLAENTILIEADAAGGEGSQHGSPYDTVAPADAGFADHFNSDLNRKFVDKQSTGGGSGPSTNSQFDMNSKGQIAAVWVDEGVVPNRYEVRVYDPIWNGAGTRIEGYTLAKIVAFNGDVDNNAVQYIVPELVTTVETSPGVFQETDLSPISGVAIDDEGRVAFTAITEIVKEVFGDWDGDFFTPDTRALVASKSALFVYEPNTQTLHRVLVGGEGGADVLSDAFIGDGNPGEADVILGFFPTEAADGFNRESFSRSGGVMAVSFRSSGTEYSAGVPTNFGTFPDGSPIPTAGPNGFLYEGGLLYDTVPVNEFRMNETGVRGVVLLQLGQFNEDFVCCPGDANGDGVVDFNDITEILGNWLEGTQPSTPNNFGDANCDGEVNFNDVTEALGNWLANCN